MSRPSPFAKTSHPAGRSTGTPSSTAPRSTRPSRGLSSKRAPTAVCGQTDGPPLGALRQLRGHAEGGVEEEVRGVEVVELAVDVVEPDQRREPVAEKVLLNPRLFERPFVRGFDAAHALSVTGKAAGAAPMDRQAIDKNRRASPAGKAFHVEREQEVQVGEVRRASPRATRQVREALGVVDEGGADTMLRESLADRLRLARGAAGSLPAGG